MSFYEGEKGSIRLNFETDLKPEFSLGSGLEIL